MAGGQQTDLGQGTATPSEDVALTGEGLAVSTGTIVADAGGGIALDGEGFDLESGQIASALFIGLRSRKVGAGSATRALTGISTSMAIGSLAPNYLKTPLGQNITTAQGAFTKSRTSLLLGQSIAGQIGTLSVSSTTLGWLDNIFPMSIPAGGFFDLQAHLTGNVAQVSSITANRAFPAGVSIANSPTWRVNATAGATLGTTGTGNAGDPGYSLTIVPTPSQVSIANFGAVADGTTNNITAINNTLAQAKVISASVLIPAGTWAYSGVINNDSVAMTGVGDTSILYAQDPANETIMMTGTSPKVQSMQLSGVTPPSRLTTLQCSRCTVNGATGFLVDNLLINTSAGAGVMDYGGSNGSITNNRINNTKADSIHNTHGANNITITGNVIQNSGDDGIAVVSYSNESICHDITARNNSISNNVGGRGMSVVGGQDVLYEQNTISNVVPSAGMLVAQEAGTSPTLGCLRITYQFNTITNCGSSATGHAGIFINDSNQFPNTTIRVTRNDIIQTQAGQIGLRVDSGQNVDIIFDQNRITGTTAGNAVLNQCTPPATVNAYVSGPVGVSTSAAADWANRISGTGVVWYHNFDSANEVSRFRWSNGYGGGNDPLGHGGDGSRVAHVASGGADGGGFMRLTYPVNTSAGGSYWWRPYAAFSGTGNGKGTDDPGANGTIPVQSWNPTDGGGQTREWPTNPPSRPSYYGHANDIAGAPANRYDGSEFYIQLRHRRAEMPGKPPDNVNFQNITGKSMWHNVTTDSSTSVEIVTYGNSQLSAVGQRDIQKMYEGSNRSGGGFIGGNNESATVINNDGINDWRYSGGWDTLLYKLTPGTDGGTGSLRTHLEVWAQHDLTLFPAESGQYVKIWDILYSASLESYTNGVGGVAYHGWNAIILAIYHNGATFTTSSFNFDYDQVIFSKATIPAPTT